MQVIHCPICGPNNEFTVQYKENFNLESIEFVARKTPDHMHFRILKCHGCGLIYSSPIIPEEKIKELYHKSHYIEEPQIELMGEDYIKEFVKFLPQMRKGGLLEIGCANGFFLERVKKYSFEKVQGIELSQEAVLHAPQTIRECIINDEFKTDLFPKEYFDVICFFQVFDHIVDPNGFLQKVHHYLKKGGILFAIHHNIESLMPRLLGEKASTYDISHIHLWNRKTMRMILEKNGFKVLSIKNIANRYQWDHVIRMLPLPVLIKRTFRNVLKKVGLSDASLRMAVENMAVVATKI